jgi:hypothetical protein
MQNCKAYARQIAALMLTLTFAQAFAHHGIANFDLNTDIEIDGVVTGVDFLNPHSWLYLDVESDGGTTERWRCELRGATVLRRSGWSEDMFPAGLRIRITGSPDRRDPTTCYLGTAFFPDGSSVDRYGQFEDRPDATIPTDREYRTASGVPNLNGDWASEQRVMTDPRGQMGTLVPVSTAEQFEPGGVPAGGQAFPGARGTEISLADDPVDTFWNERPSLFPLTPAGTAAIAGFDGASTDNPRLRCEATNIMFDWTFEADINQIEQHDDRIILRYGSMGIERTIHLDMDAHPANAPLTRAGHSIGRWEDDTLVVETTAFEPGIVSADGRLPHSSQMVVVERFTLDPETFALTRVYTAEDPTYFEGTYRGRDVVLPSPLPFHGTTECEDRTYVDDTVTEVPWWAFWRWFD